MTWQTALAKIKELEGAVAAVEVTSEAATQAADQEFDKGFFQGYSDLKRRVAVDHSEWDLSGYSGVDSDFFDVEEDEPAPEHTEAEPNLPVPAERAGIENEEVGDTELVDID